ncbi:hypothetical protein TRIATDRAFT_229251 [Trichoderma atroviride IMI 206040]|uniref:Azaphilone pigments biosynthesis cluster protein L N-terminal domain-containing protein n=1 Tax=Hypocrea atroviridis (strain ATCC 20476 / IMI 206040) TaxID=452589 RepID=G9P494_HYPAI|nr:uncharacterized protein TRIATDRAFT_229251 [Trichoderma atroviride IMI 206040]EHK41938.1 hypothetical protein TRIATDRAFT_229251 [Trichoderma atroviride IMI 206040]
MDSIDISCGVLTLLTSAIQAGKSLHETIQSFRNYERTIRDLRSELESLIQVLESLKNVITDEGPIVSMLKLPVLCCHQTCQEFNAVIIKCTKHASAGSRTSFRDWAQIRYMGGDIRDFKDMLSGYKSTIAIALGSLNMFMIRETTADLEVHLQSIDDKLAALADHPRSEPDPNAALTVKRMEEERQSAQQCILICESAKSHIQSLQDNMQRLDAEPNQDRRQTAVALSEARDRMVLMITDLQKRLVDLSAKSLSTEVSLRSDEFEQDRARLLKEIDTAKQCLEVCNMAADQASRQRVHVFGDVSAEDNSQQIIVSTVGDLLNAKNIKVGSFSSQWLGSMTDTSLQQLSMDRTAQYININARESDPSFGGRYGSGYRLNERGKQSAVGVGRTK